MVVKSNFKQTKIFRNCLSVRYLFLKKKLKRAVGIKPNSQQSDFFTVIQKQKTTKPNNYNFFTSPGKLEKYCKQERQHW